MEEMFAGANQFNAEIGGWDTSAIEIQENLPIGKNLVPGRKRTPEQKEEATRNRATIREELLSGQ